MVKRELCSCRSGDFNKSGSKRLLMPETFRVCLEQGCPAKQ
jgi:hypothetical protein